MQCKRPFLAFVSKRDPHKDLEFMYARKYALDTLIRSLEEYDEVRRRRLEPDSRKTA